MTAESTQSDSAGSRAPDSTRPTGLLDVLNVGALVLDADGRIVFWTPQAEELIGYTAEEALGKYAARLIIHPEHMQAVSELF
ncbi:PAS domain-containing protein, partial [Streptomyces sp. NPDC005070]